MAEGQPPLFKKLALDLLRDHVFSDTPAWVTIDDTYNDCIKYALSHPLHAVKWVNL